MIKEIGDKRNLERSAEVIRKSFATVAQEFGLTEQNCPTNPAFITFEKLEKLHARGARFFALYEGDSQLGFVAMENADSTTCYLEKLAVLPEYRGRGYGKDLVGFVFDYVRSNGGTKVSIGIMDNHRQLKDWYKRLGFVETGTKRFDHLPFTVCFMEKSVGGSDS